MSPSRNSAGAPRAEIYVEFVRVGNAVKATALDPVSGQEISVVGPATALQSDLQMLAVSRLRSILDGSGKDNTESQKQTPPISRRGIVV